MSLQEKIDQIFLESVKAKDTIKVGVLRMMKSAILNKKIEKAVAKEDNLADDDIIAIFKTEVKKRNDSLTTYRDAGRDDLADIEAKEIEIIEAFLPEQMSEEAVLDVVKAVVLEVGASGQADFGKVMGMVMAKTGGKSDGQVVSRLVKEALS
jgi:uncharacterized protein